MKKGFEKGGEKEQAGTGRITGLARRGHCRRAHVGQKREDSGRGEGGVEVAPRINNLMERGTTGQCCVPRQTRVQTGKSHRSSHHRSSTQLPTR